MKLLVIIEFGYFSKLGRSQKMQNRRSSKPDLILELKNHNLNVIKASTAVIYGRITTVTHSPCYKTFLRP